MSLRLPVDDMPGRGNARRMAALASFLSAMVGGQSEGRRRKQLDSGGQGAPRRTHYAPGKPAIEALTRNVSAEMTTLGIRVNRIHPGPIDTTITLCVMRNPNILPAVLLQISLSRAWHWQLSEIREVNRYHKLTVGGHGHAG